MSDTKIIHTVNSRTLIKNNLRNYSMFIVLALIMVVFGFLTEWNNFSPRNFTYICFQFSYVLILATDMVQCIIILGIDLSVGSVCAFIGALSAYIYNARVGGLPLTLLAAVVMGACVGAFQGCFVAYAKIPAFIVTLAGMMLFRGLTYIVTGVNPVSLIDDGYSYLSTGTVDELLHLEPSLVDHYPVALILALILLVVFWAAQLTGRKTRINHGFEVAPEPIFYAKMVVISILVLALAERFGAYRGLPVVVLVLGAIIGVFHFITRNTVLGRYIYAVGGNAAAAKLSGISTGRITVMVYTICGFTAALTGIMMGSRLGSAQPSAGTGQEMIVIAACIVGGTSTFGGRGTFLGTAIGAFFMNMLTNSMTLMRVDIYYQNLVVGAVLVFAVILDQYTRASAQTGRTLKKLLEKTGTVK